MSSPLSRVIGRVAYSASQLPRIAWYVAHSLVLRRLSEQAQRRNDNNARPHAQTNLPVPDRRRLYTDMAILLQQDLANVEAGIYPLPADHDGSLLTLLDRSRLFFEDLPEINRRRESSASNEVLTEDTRAKRQSPLRRATASFYYQPKRDLSRGTISGVEALLRWHHPDLGLLQPNRFIPLAEETGLIVPIGKWVLETACAQNMAWQRRGLPAIRVAVNLSPRQFADPHLLDDIHVALERSGMPPDLLELEITESMVMQNVDRAVRVLEAIKGLGITLAIDDFGTGYSSMSLVKKFPIDVLKIDRSFVRGITNDSEDQAIADAIIALGRALDLTIVAEGVETAEQEAFLRAHNCDEIQGYLISKPVPADEFAAFLANYTLEELKALQPRQTMKSYRTGPK